MKLIDADALEEAIMMTGAVKVKDEETAYEFAGILANAPAVDAIPVVHGRWLNIPDKPEWDQKMCSVCGDYFCCQVNYCPNCGAKMDRSDNDETD